MQKRIDQRDIDWLNRLIGAQTPEAKRAVINEPDPFGGNDPLAELARLIGSSDPFAGQMPEERRDTIDRIIDHDGPPPVELQQQLFGQSVCQLCPHPIFDAFFFPGSILAGREHVFALPDNERNGLVWDSMEPMRQAFFYRDMHTFRIAEN